MKKYKLYQCEFEITRKCNKNCLHCMRGDSENITMPEWVIDKAIDEIANIDYILIGSGEPLLEIGRIEYLIDKINNSDWTTSAIELTTNGTICDTRIIEIYEKFCNKHDERYAILRISNDEFHNPDEYEKAFNFYKPLVDSANNRLMHKNSMIRLIYTKNGNDSRFRLSYEGRAVDYVKNMGEQKYFETMSDTFPLYAYEICRPHRLKIVDNQISCALNILASGKVSFSEPVSHQKLDSLSIGSLENNTFSKLIENHNDNCLVLCSEECVAINSKNIAVYPGHKDYTESYAKIRTIIMERIFELRHIAREHYPHIPTQVIIDSIQFPNSEELSELIMRTYEHSPYYTKNMISEFTRYSGTDKAAPYMGAICRVVLMYWNHTTERKYPYWLFGDTDDIDELLAEKFEGLEIEQAQMNNSKVYICNPDDIKIHDVLYDASVDVETFDYAKEVAEIIKSIKAST